MDMGWALIINSSRELQSYKGVLETSTDPFFWTYVYTVSHTLNTTILAACKILKTSQHMHYSLSITIHTA